MAKPIFATNDVPTATQFNEWLVNVNWARKTANESVASSTTLQTDDHLFVAVQANSVYFVTCSIMYDGDSTADIKVLFRCPTSATLRAAGLVLVGGAASQSDNQNSPILENTSSVWGCLGSGTNHFAVVTGVLITAGTAGNFALEWSQNVSSGTATRVLAGSVMNLDRKE